MPNTFFDSILYLIHSFVFLYPAAMSIIWIIGGLSHWYIHEYKYPTHTNINYIPITILIPCHNEEKTIELTCKNLSDLNYFNYTVIFVDDGSTDNTINIIRNYTNQISFYHILIIEDNKGKAHALNIALKLVETPYVLVMDADTILKRDTLKYFVTPFLYNKNLGAVTGNPIPINRCNLLSKFQTAEFMSIIGLIKRTQHTFGQIFTVSGCATAYKTEILKKINGFSINTATEDIDVTWKIQRIFKDIYFEPKASVFIQVPTTFKEYWKQRERWARGGWHVLRNHREVFIHRKHKKLKALYIDFSIAYSWSFSFVLFFLISIMFFIFSKVFIIGSHFLWQGSITSFLCIIQMFVAININKTYDTTLSKVLLWVPWYALLFFMINAFLVVFTFPRGVFGNLEKEGKWCSPTRRIE